MHTYNNIIHNEMDDGYKHYASPVNNGGNTA